MAILSANELTNKVKTIIGDNNDNDTIAFLEDFTDTIKDYEAKSKDTTDWHKKYDELDADWRKKYTDRFFEGGESSKEDDPHTSHEDETEAIDVRVEDLFTEKKE